VPKNALQRVKKNKRFVKCFGFDGFGIAFDSNEKIHSPIYQRSPPPHLGVADWEVIRTTKY
jgi:hypothetical protein